MCEGARVGKTTCKFYMTQEYEEKINDLLSTKNIFEVDAFKTSHQFVIIDQETMPGEDEVKPEDIWAVDDITYGAFLDHLDCYFRGG
jgi:hypothetical protein